MQLEEVQNLCLLIKSSAVNPDRKEIFVTSEVYCGFVSVGVGGVEIDASAGVYAKFFNGRKTRLI